MFILATTPLISLIIPFKNIALTIFIEQKNLILKTPSLMIDCHIITKSGIYI